MRINLFFVRVHECNIISQRDDVVGVFFTFCSFLFLVVIHFCRQSFPANPVAKQFISFVRSDNVKRFVSHASHTRPSASAARHTFAVVNPANSSFWGTPTINKRKREKKKQETAYALPLHAAGIRAIKITQPSQPGWIRAARTETTIKRSDWHVSVA